MGEPRIVPLAALAKTSAAIAAEQHNKADLIARLVVSPGLHVYAPGNPGYVPLELTFAETPGVRAGRLTLPAPEELLFNVSDLAYVYTGTFQLRQEVMLSPDFSQTGAIRSSRHH